MSKFIKEVGKYIKFKLRQFIESRFFLGLVCLIIGSTFTLCYLVGKPYYEWAKTGYSYSMDAIERQVGEVAEAKAEAGSLENQDVSITDADANLENTTLSIDLSDYIWLHESTRGKNNYSKCEAIGKVNGIGYGIWGERWMCFDSHKEEMETLKKWIQDKKDKGMSDKELLCLYSGNNYLICK